MGANVTTPTATLEREALRPLARPDAVQLPESAGYRFKIRLLGRPLHNDQLAHERLGRPTALAVFASDALSSTAYATEEIIRTLLLGGLGVLAFSYVVPITLAMVVVLVILMFSYRQTIKAYPSAGGAYIVTKDNLGLLPAQVAGVALLTDYILTVAVSVSAGVAALYSAFSVLQPFKVPIALVFIALIAWGNLRGVKESGRVFAVPTYLFLVAMFLMIATGLVRWLTNGLDPVEATDPAALRVTSTASLFLLLHAFASGGAAMTGVEAISNGVPAFKPPEWKNARSTLMVMGACLGTMFVGISWLAKTMRVVPSDDKTVLSQIAQGVYGTGALGHALFFVTQAATMLILVLAANTSFADFPRLASFHAHDAFMPKQLTQRGHRLVFSNGIIALAVTAAVLVVVFQADVTHLIPLYAIGVFTSFTLSQAGMAVHHKKEREDGWRLGIVINGTGAVVTGIVTIVIAVSKFTHGAWFIIVLVPFLVAVLVRLNRQYESENEELDAEVQGAVRSPILPRHAVLVLVGDLDRSTARALQYARTLMPDELRAVHLAADPQHAQELAHEWSTLDLRRVPLEIVECADRRLDRGLLHVVASELDGRTEVSVLIPRREYPRFWHRLLHDRTSNTLADALTTLPHANVTFVPYQMGRQRSPITLEEAADARNNDSMHTNR
jgi:amino acid transporter